MKFLWVCLRVLMLVLTSVPAVWGAPDLFSNTDPQPTMNLKSLDQLVEDPETLLLVDSTLSHENGIGWRASVPPERSAEEGISLLPVPYLSYSDVYGVIYNLAMALYEPASQTRATATLLSNLNGYLRGRGFFQWRRPDTWIFTITGSVGNDTQNYFGEGDQTSNIYQSYNDNLNQVSSTFQLNLTQDLYIGPSVQYINQDWNANAQAADPTIFQNEDEFKIGFQLTYDARDVVIEPRKGSYVQIGAFGLPSSGNSGIGADVLQFEGDARTYIPLGVPILALRAKTAWSTGTPSYAFEYSLGGMNELRGYHTNRFRGVDFYEGQAELRVPFYDDLIELTTGLDGGDITDNTFNGPQFSYQIGARSNLLSSFGVIIRMDIGFGYDGTDFALATYEPF